MKPRIKHFACMVDLLGRAEFVEEALDLIKGMEVKPDINVWGALLSACRIEGNVEIAELTCGKLLELEPENIEYYLLLANVYASCGKWNEVSIVRAV